MALRRALSARGPAAALARAAWGPGHLAAGPAAGLAGRGILRQASTPGSAPIPPGAGAPLRGFCGVPHAGRKVGGAVLAVGDRVLRVPPSVGSGSVWKVLARNSSSESAGTVSRLKGMVPAVGKSAAAARGAVAKATRIPPQAKDALRAAKRFAGKTPTYRDASKFLALRIEALWQNNKRPIMAASLVIGSIVMWRLVFGVASTFVNLSETFAEAGFLALGIAMALFFLQYYRARSTINPDRMYQLAFGQLNSHAGVRELMGVPLVGTDVRAYIMAGGGVKLNLQKSLRPKWKRERAHLIFPLRGSEKRGLVSVIAKRRHGQYQFKMVAVDVPAAAGGNTRIFLVGDQADYDRAGVISELRDPLLNALAGEPAFDEDDDRDEEEEEATKRASKQGMRGWERALDWVQTSRDKVKRLLAPKTSAE